MADDYDLATIGPGQGGPMQLTGGGPNTFAGGDFFGNNPALLGGLGAAGVLGYNAFKGGGDLPYAPQMQGAIQNLGGIAQIGQGGYDELMGKGRALSDPILTGQLPAGQEQVIKNMIKGQETATKGRYASLGLSGSTMEGDALVNVQNQAMNQRVQMEYQMAQLGAQAVQQAIQELGISEKAFGDQAQAYGKMMEAQMKADTNTSNAIAGFAKAIGTAAAMMI